jgi:hypothetical protein
MNHSFGWFGRGMEEVVAIATSSRKKDGVAFAECEMAENPNTQWIYNYAKRFPDQVGCSIDARAKVREGEAKDGHLWGDTSFDPEDDNTPMVYVVEEIVFLNSVDFVTYPAAGGGVESVMASMNDPVLMKKYQNATEAFNNILFGKEDKAEQINSQTQEETSMDYKELTREALAKERPDLVQAVQDEAREAIQKEQAGETAQDLQDKLTEAEKSNTELSGKLETAETALTEANREKDELKVWKDDQELKDKVSAKKAEVDGMIAESELADEHVSDVFREDLYKIEESEEITKRIADRIAIVKGSVPAVSGHGQRTEGEDDEPPVQESEKSDYAGDDALAAELNR